jgi:hypothetical protein
MRVTATPLQPSREAAWLDPIDPALADADLGRAIDAAGVAQRRFAEELRAQLGYDLVTHNCVSELFQTIEAADVQLGGHVGSPWSLDFIPFVSAGAVDRQWDVTERPTVPSYRQIRLAEMSGREGWWARVRESNVVSSTIYQRNDADSAFLFFTDDALLPRPVFGALNLAVGIGAGVAGLARLPVDGGAWLSAGLRGVLYSLPELAFVNLRKGSFDYVPAAVRKSEALRSPAAVAAVGPRS